MDYLIMMLCSVSQDQTTAGQAFEFEVHKSLHHICHIHVKEAFY